MQKKKILKQNESKKKREKQKQKIKYFQHLKKCFFVVVVIIVFVGLVKILKLWGIFVILNAKQCFKLPSRCQAKGKKIVGNLKGKFCRL